MMDRVQWDDETRADIEAALNEGDVLGIRLDPAGAWCDVLVHVLALPESGPLDCDPRRVLRLAMPGQVSILLRTDRVGKAGYGPAISLSGLDAVEDFFASLSWSGAMYGWKFLDDPSLTRDWPARPSLTVQVRPGTAPHSLYWFNECGRTEGDASASYLIEGTVTFEDLEVMRADAVPEGLEQFIADGQRHWQAFFGHDERLSGEAQRGAQNGTPSWRPHARRPVTSGGSWPQAAAGVAASRRGKTSRAM